MFDLAAEMAKLPEPVTTEKPPQWAFWRHQLWELAQREPAQNFVSWACIRHTMLSDHFEDMVEHERSEMLRVSGKLPASPYAFNQSLERNNVRQLYHLWKFEQVTGKRIADLESIVEIGGGYGAMCEMARRMGFQGEYTIYDLKEFSLLQQWYLEQVGLVANFATEVHLRTPTDLLIGIYSLAEMPYPGREVLLTSYPAQSHLYLYSGKWEAYDNVAYFQDKFPYWRESYHEEAAHHHDRHNYYSIGIS